VLKILNFFVDLCLLRRAPQDLDGSPALFLAALGINALAGLVLGLQSWGETGPAFVATLIDLGVMLSLLRLALRLKGHPHRLRQTATALLGTGVLFSLLALPLQPLFSSDETAETGALLYLGLVIWLQVVYGHVLRQALDVSLPAGIGMAIVYTLTSAILIQLLFPLPAA
jgi:hypothetical protein